jgi:hypothetical protein
MNRFSTRAAACATLVILCACNTAPTAAPSAAASAPAAASASMSCTLAREADQYKGSCGIPCEVHNLAVNFDGIKRGFSCNEPLRQVPASLQATAKSGQWLGEMQGRQPEDPTRFELTSGSGGVAKLPYGWFAVQSVREQAGSMTINLAPGKQVPPTANDIKILQRATQLIPSVAAWNKNDDRNCSPNPQKLSLFCALMQATTEVSGGIHYRQPALQAVREVLNEVGGNRLGKHRLMDYNNHPDTTLQEIHSLLRTAQTRVEKDIR